MDIFISGAAQISLQEPLGTGWFEAPALPDGVYHRATEADYRQFIAPMAARRMGRLLKRAVAVSVRALQQAELNMPDAIISGTGLGCTDETEKFLSAMTFQGEELLQPSHFIQSTHNTIGSQIALHLQCHGYNSTFAHTGISFESALLDACTLLQTGRIGSALVGGHDEMTPGYFNLLEKTGWWKAGATQDMLRKADTPGAMAGESSVAMALTRDRRPSSLARITGIQLLYSPTDSRIAEAAGELLHGARPDAVMTGWSGDCADARTISHVSQQLFGNQTPLLWYRHAFGTSHTVSACGMLTAALCLQRPCIPEVWVLANGDRLPAPGALQRILCLEQFRNKAFALTCLESC